MEHSVLEPEFGDLPQHIFCCQHSFCKILYVQKFDSARLFAPVQMPKWSGEHCAGLIKNSALGSVDGTLLSSRRELKFSLAKESFLSIHRSVSGATSSRRKKQYKAALWEIRVVFTG
jgi:hypothetical protein